jgi:hypothetical protein
MLHPGQFLRRLVDEKLDRVLITQPVAAGHGVVEMILETVVVLDDASGATLGGDGVAAHRVDLGDQGDTQVRIRLRNGDGGAQSRTSGPDDNNIRSDRFHG